MRELLRTRSVPVPAADRPRRLRRTAALRSLVRETRLAPGQLVMPLFVISGRDRLEPIDSLPGHARLSADRAVAKARELAQLGVGGVLLFGIPDRKDDEGTGAYDQTGPVPSALRALKEAGLPLVLAADVCMCEYTSHGHCGIVPAGRARGTLEFEVDNDATLPLLAEAAVVYAEAGADVVGPSGMMDGQVAALRAALDAAGHTGTAIMAYASKAASAFYGPFRDAAGSTPAFGDRRGYQMDYSNAREAIREMELDVREGADILMVKPALTSLDLLARARRRFDVPLAAYHVSGEVAMLEAAAERGWLDRKSAGLEMLTAIVRAGAGIVITYLAADAARWLSEDPSR
jgi:porphobilinogen synthase